MAEKRWKIEIQADWTEDYPEDWSKEQIEELLWSDLCEDNWEDTLQFFFSLLSRGLKEADPTEKEKRRPSY